MNIHDAIRLLQEPCALHHTALNTEKSYVRCVRHYALFLQKPQPKRLLTTETKIEAFLTTLALRDVSASTQKAFNALVFFYRYALKRHLLFAKSVHQNDHRRGEIRRNAQPFLIPMRISGYG